jgi:hypothetical protein
MLYLVWRRGMDFLVYVIQSDSTMEAAWLDELEGEGNRCSLFFGPNNTFASCETEKLYEFIGFLRKETHNILENQPWWFKQTAAKLGTPFRGVSRP